MNTLPLALLDCLSPEQLEGIASGELVVHLVEYKGEGLALAQAYRDAQLATSRDTVRADVGIEAERTMRWPDFYITEVEKAS